MIRLRGVSKRYWHYANPWHRLLHLVPEWVPVPHHHPREFWALRDITGDIAAGSTVGIIGPNGAGKSTLLKIIARTTFQTEGVVEVDGSVAALLELGTGFHPEFTGRQNIYINGRMLGLSEAELREREQEIIDFAELSAFIDQPLRTFSSGMTVRLGFAVAACVRPQVLIVDEALSVGDAAFSQKCVAKIREFKANGATILFVSHDPGLMAALCDDVILLHRGKMLRRGAPADVLDEYNELIARLHAGNRSMRRAESLEVSSPMLPAVTTEDAPEHESSIVVASNGQHAEEAPAALELAPVPASTPRRMGSFLAFVESVTLLDAAGRATETPTSGADVTLRIDLVVADPVAQPTVGIMIRDRIGQVAYATNTWLQGKELGRHQPGDRVRLDWSMRLDLGPGEYTMTVAAHVGPTHLDHCFDWIDRALSFRVVDASGGAAYGHTLLHPKLDVGALAGTAAQLGQRLAALFAGVPTKLPASSWDAHESSFLRGWYPPEPLSSPGFPPFFRWMEPDALVALGAGRALNVWAAAWGRDSDAGEVRLTITALGHPQYRQEMIWSVGTAEHHSVALPTVPANTPLLIRFQVSPPLMAAGRSLGLAILGLDAS